MIKGTKEYLDGTVSKFICPEHPDLALTVAWHPEGFYVIRCGGNHYPEEVTRQPSLTELHKQGVELDEPIKSNVEKSIRKREAQRSPGPVAKFMGGVPVTDLATGVSLTLEQAQGLVSYAYKYALDPFRGHVVMMHGKPYIGVDGYLFHANKTKTRYSMTGRPLTDDELKRMGYQPNDFGWKTTIKFIDGGQEFEGYGFVTTTEVTATAEGKPYQFRYPVVHEKPGNMVVKRSEWQAFRRAFPIGESEKEEEK